MFVKLTSVQVQDRVQSGIFPPRTVLAKQINRGDIIALQQGVYWVDRVEKRKMISIVCINVMNDFIMRTTTFPETVIGLYYRRSETLAIQLPPYDTFEVSSTAITTEDFHLVSGMVHEDRLGLVNLRDQSNWSIPMPDGWIGTRLKQGNGQQFGETYPSENKYNVS